jgi:hypothetical protein
MQEYRAQLQQGAIQQAYRGLMDYMQSLRLTFQKNHPEFTVSGNLYFGYMDMTYFAIIPPLFKERSLKIAVVFNHPAFRFEVWLSGVNRQVQEQVWKSIREAGWEQYPLVADPKSSDAILEHILIQEPDFSDLDLLTSQIERGTLEFIRLMDDCLTAIRI